MRSGDVSVAYQVVGDGPFDVILIPGFVSHVELVWSVEPRAVILRQLASFSRLIVFDKRGTGMSDRVSGAPTLETRMDDVRAVMDAAGSQRAALVGLSEGAPMSVLFAATYPERTAALVLWGAFARMLVAVGYPMGSSDEEYRRELEADLRLFAAKTRPRRSFARSALTIRRRCACWSTYTGAARALVRSSRSRG